METDTSFWILWIVLELLAMAGCVWVLVCLDAWQDDLRRARAQLLAELRRTDHQMRLARLRIETVALPELSALIPRSSPWFWVWTGMRSLVLMSPRRQA